MNFFDLFDAENVYENFQNCIIDFLSCALLHYCRGPSIFHVHCWTAYTIVNNWGLKLKDFIVSWNFNLIPPHHSLAPPCPLPIQRPFKTIDPRPEPLLLIWWNPLSLSRVKKPLYPNNEAYWTGFFARSTIWPDRVTDIRSLRWRIRFLFSEFDTISSGAQKWPNIRLPPEKKKKRQTDRAPVVRAWGRAARIARIARITTLIWWLGRWGETAPTRIKRDRSKPKPWCNLLVHYTLRYTTTHTIYRLLYIKLINGTFGSHAMI